MSLYSRFRQAAAAFRSDSSSWDTLVQMLKGGKSAAGVSVNRNTVLTLSAAYNAQVIVSETMSTIPLQIFKKSSEGRVEVDSHPLYEVLHLQANPIESSQTFRQRIVWDIELEGIGLAEKIHDSSGRIRELWHIPSRELLEVELRGNQLWFHIGSQWYSSDKVFYVYGPGQDGLTPRSRLRVMNEAIGLGLAANEFGARYFSNGTNMGGFIEFPKGLNDNQFKRLKTSIDEGYTGLEKSHKLILLEEGGKFTKANSSNEDSQFLETRQFQIAEVARFYNIPPHLIGDLSRSTNNNIEHQGIEAVRYSWRPRAIRIEASINTQLLEPNERKKIYAEHNLNGLMQGDFMSQMNGWHLAVQDGIYNADEVRKMLNMNNQDGGQGSIYFMPANMYNKQDVKDGKTLQTKQNPVQTQKNDDSDVNPVQKDQKSLGNHDFYAEILKKNPTIDAFRAYAAALIPTFQTEFKSRFSPDEYKKATEKLLSAQEKRTAGGFGPDEYARMRNAFHLAAMQASGVKAVVWRSKSDCPHCQHLNGQIRPLNEPFQDKIRHAPLVSGCDCDIEEADHA